MQEHLTSVQVKKLARQQKRESLEDIFLRTWKQEFPNLPVPERQYRHNPIRKWRWDFRIDHVLVDIQGGTFVRGGHSRGVGQDRDYEKWNDAVRMGYKPLLFGTNAMKDPVSVVTDVAEIWSNAKEIANDTGPVPPDRRPEEGNP
jgi:hypothetical protein